MIGELAGGAIDLYGGNKAANIERRGTRKAGGILDKGYGTALDLAKPMQEQGQQDYMNLSNRYRAGEFRNPEQAAFRAGSFNYDPNQIFNDPEYKAQMQAGTEAINSGAAGKGMLFSGNTGRALQQFGSNLFAGRSDDLYNRARGQYENDRNFDYNAQNRAYDVNAENRAADYAQGAGLARYAPGALDRSIGLNISRAQDAADTELGVAGIRGNAYRTGARKAGEIAGKLGNWSEKFLPETFKLGAA